MLSKHTILHTILQKSLTNKFYNFYSYKITYDFQPWLYKYKWTLLLKREKEIRSLNIELLSKQAKSFFIHN